MPEGKFFLLSTGSGEDAVYEKDSLETAVAEFNNYPHDSDSSIYYVAQALPMRARVERYSGKVLGYELDTPPKQYVLCYYDAHAECVIDKTFGIGLLMNELRHTTSMGEAQPREVFESMGVGETRTVGSMVVVRIQ